MDLGCPWDKKGPASSSLETEHCYLCRWAEAGVCRLPGPGEQSKGQGLRDGICVPPVPENGS